MKKALSTNDVKKVVRDVIKEERIATKDDIKEALASYATKDDIISFKDEILKEIKDLRVDVTIVTGYRDMIEDHDQRIEAIEEKIGIPAN